MNEQPGISREELRGVLYEGDLLLERFIDSADANSFLSGLEAYYNRLRPATLAFEDEESMVKAFVLHNWRMKDQSPEEFGSGFWRHENAHKQASIRHGVSNTVRLVLPVDGVYYAFAEFNIDDMRRVTGSDPIKVLNILGQVWVAPSFVPDAHGRSGEMRNGVLFLNIASQWQRRRDNGEPLQKS